MGQDFLDIYSTHNILIGIEKRNFLISVIFKNFSNYLDFIQLELHVYKGKCFQTACPKMSFKFPLNGLKMIKDELNVSLKSLPLVSLSRSSPFSSLIQSINGYSLYRYYSPWDVLGAPEVTANIYCKSLNLPNTTTQITVQICGNFWASQ